MKISVIITTRNRSKLLRQALESALGQEPCGADIEIIVVDDDSNDDTPAVVAPYRSVCYIRTRQGTCSGTRNVGISRAQGEWIAFLDDDDVWLPHKLRISCEIIRANPQARLIFSGATICDYGLNPGAVWQGPELTEQADAYEAFLDHMPSPSATLVHKDIFERVGLFDPTVPRAEDRDIWFRILQHNVPCASTSEALILYRLREKESGELLCRSYRDTMEVFRRHFAPGAPKRPPWRRRQQVLWRTRGWYAHQLMMASRQERQDGNRRGAVRFARAAFAVSPAHGLKLWLKGAGDAVTHRT